MAKGDVVLINFPFTDLSGSKLRLAVESSFAGLHMSKWFILRAKIC